MENFSTFVRTLGTQFVKGKKFFTTQLGVVGILTDGTGSPGTAGKVLSSTGTGVEWITVGGGTSNVADLDDLTDVIITTASTGQLLRFNGTSWVNWTPNFLTAYGSLNDLSDVTLTTPVNGARLIYSSSTSQWIDANPLGVNKIYYGTASGDAETTNVITNGTRLSVGTLAMPTNLNVGQVDITTGIVGEGSIHIGGISDNEVYLLASRNKIQVGSQVVTFVPGEGEGDPGTTTTTFTASTLNIQPIGGQTVFGGLVTATGFKIPLGNNKQILLANGTVTSTNSATSGQILRWIESGGVGQWLADDENQYVPTLQQVTNAGNSTTTGITAGSFTTTGFISGGNITGTKVTTPTVEFNGAISTNSIEQVDQGDPNPNVFYAKWNGDVQFTVNGDGYAIARTGYKVTGATGGFLKADGTIDTSTYLTSYTETQTLNDVTTLGSSTTNAISVGGLTSTSVTTPLVESSGLLIIDADTTGGLQPDQGDPAVPVLSFDWQGNTQGYIDTDGKITFNGFKTPSGTSSGFLKADGSIDTNTYLTSVAPYALDDLTDVNASNPQDGEFLKFDDITGEWINAAIPTPTLDSVTTAGNATANTIDVGGITTPYVQFEENLAPPEAHRSVNWSEDHNTLEVYYALEKHFDVGQDQMWYVKNGTEGILAKGTVVMAVGAVGNSGKIEVAPLVADGTVSGRYAVGILMDDVRAGEFGFAMTQGTIRGLSTGEFTEGDTLYADPLVDGALTNVEPSSPALKLPIAFVVTSAQNGAIAVRMTQGLDLHEVHDVQITTPSNGQLLRYASGTWENWTPDYLTEETDPVFTASAAATISTTNISNWDTAYGWGNHALAGYLTTETDPTVPSYVKEITEQNIIDWNKAYGWGNHADAGYATTGYVTTAIANLVDSAPSTLDTLNELAAALGDDPNFATTITNSIAGKVSKAGESHDTVLPDTLGAGQGGFYTVAGTSGPSGGNDALVHIPYSSSNWAHQIAMDWETGNSQDMWFRTKYDGTWQSWKKVWHDGNFTNNSSNWDTAFGWGNHASAGYLTSVPSEYLTKSGADSLYQPLGSYLTAETDTLQSVTERGNETTTGASFGGNVGIGTTIPAVRLNGKVLSLNDTGEYIQSSIELLRNGNSSGEIFVNADNMVIGSYEDAIPLTFRTLNSERLRITSEGYVGIGTTTPYSRLDVHDTIYSFSKPVISGSTLGTIIYKPTGEIGIYVGGIYESIPSISTYSNDSHNFNSAAGPNIVTISTTDFTWLGETVATRAWVLANVSGGGISGSGTANYVTKWTSGSAVGNSSIYDNGNVGIGTTSPNARLHVSGGDGIINNALIGEVPTYTLANAQFSHTSRAGAGEYSFLSASDGETFINSKTGYNIRFRVNNTDQVIINSSGNVGIGTTSPSIPRGSGFRPMLHVYNNSVGTNPSVVVSCEDNQMAGYIAGDNAGASDIGWGWNAYYQGSGNNFFNIRIGDNGTWTDRFTIDRYGNVGIGTTSPTEKLDVNGNAIIRGTITETSSRKLKENIAPLEPSLDKVNQLEAVTYNRIGQDDTEIGLIAEDVAELFPEVITYNEEGQPQGIQYQRLSVILLKAVQELTERVNKLENK